MQELREQTTITAYNITCKVKCDDVASQIVNDEFTSLLDGKIKGNSAAPAVMIVKAIPTLEAMIPFTAFPLKAKIPANNMPNPARAGTTTVTG